MDDTNPTYYKHTQTCDYQLSIFYLVKLTAYCCCYKYHKDRVFITKYSRRVEQVLHGPH